MFSNYSSPVIGFSTISHVKRQASENGTQTSEKQSEDQAPQASSSQSIETQTDTPIIENKKYNEKALAAFLTRVEPLLHEELDIVADFSELEKDNVNEESSLGRITRYIAPEDVLQKKVSTMSWNSTEGTLAVGFAAVRHDTWCTHESKLVFYNTTLHRPAPPRFYNTASCVTSVQFHPNEPSIVLTGLYNGAVLVWDLRKDDEWVAVESQTEHNSQVVNVGWCDELITSAYDCYSAEADGCILLRKVGFTNRNITTQERFLITREYLNSRQTDRDEGLEIMVVSQLDNDSCVIGVGGGGLLHCSLSPLQPPTRRHNHKDPVKKVYQSHETVVTTIRTGPGPKMFASASSDGQIRVYKVLEAEPHYVVNTKECPLDIFWTDSIGVFGMCASDNSVIFVRATTGAVLEMSLKLIGDSPPTVTEAISHRSIVAVGDASGNVEIWRFIKSTHSG